MANFAILFYNPASSKYEFVVGPNPNQTFDAVDGTDANSAACLANNINGKYVALNTGGPVQASYGTAFESPVETNLIFTADVAGTAGNSIRIRYVVAGNNTPLSVSVASNDITVNLATSAGGVPTSTAAQVLAAINASGPASALISVAHEPGSTGAGVIPAAFGYTNLLYGASGAAVASLVEQVETTNASPTTY